jgi:hypothetical protein
MSVLHLHLQCSPDIRALKGVLGLDAICVWLANALNARPVDYAAEKAMEHACTTRKRADDSSLWTYITQANVFAIYELTQPRGVLQLPTHALPDADVIAAALSHKNWAALMARIIEAPHPICYNPLTSNPRCRNIRSRIQAPTPDLPTADEEGNGLPFDVDQHQGTYVVQDNLTFSEYVYSLMGSIMCEVTEKVSNKRGGSNYLAVSVDPRAVELDFFKCSLAEDLPKHFWEFVLLAPDASNWANGFDRIFPKRGVNLPNTSVWTTMRSWVEWGALMERLEPVAWKEVRAAVRVEFNTFTWIPMTFNDKVWKSATKTGTHRGFRSGPWILAYSGGDWEAVPNMV